MNHQEKVNSIQANITKLTASCSNPQSSIFPNQHLHFVKCFPIRDRHGALEEGFLTLDGKDDLAASPSKVTSISYKVRNAQDHHDGIDDRLTRLLGLLDELGSGGGDKG